MPKLAVFLCGLWLLLYVGAAKSKKENRDRPRNVTLEAVDPTKITVSWEGPRTQARCPVTRYIIRLKDDRDAESDAERVDGEATSFTLTGLKPDTKYFVRLVAVGCRGKSVPTKWVKTKTPPGDETQAYMRDEKIVRVEDKVPGKPSEVRTRTLTDSIILSWESPDDHVLVRGYMVGYGEGVPDVNWQYVDANTRTFTIRNLKPSTQYVISLRAFNNFGKGPVVYDLIYTREEHGPTPGPLASPIGLQSKVLSPSTVWLQWQDPSLGRSQKITDDRYYIISYSAQPKGKVQSMTVKAMNVVVYDLEPATTYEFRVKTRKQSAETAFSISAYNTTFESAPTSAPQSFTAHATNTSTTVLLSWQPPKQANGIITGYLIFYTSRRTNKERDWMVEGVLGDIFQVTVRELTPDTNYYFKIQARNSKGYGPTSDTISYHTPPDRTQVTSSARPPVGEAEHVAFAKDDDDNADDNEDEDDDNADDNDAPEDVTDDEEDDTVIQPEETVEPYALRQIDGATLTGEKLAMTSSVTSYSADSALSKPEDVSLHMLVRHKVSVVLAWAETVENRDFSHYHLQYYEENDVTTKESITSQVPVFVIEDLRPGRLYLYELRKEGTKNNILWRRSGTIDTSSTNKN